jgi:general secretion pathway protein D
MDNVALLRDPTGYRLVPAPEALGGASVDRTATAEPGFGISIVPLRHVSAQNMLKLLDGFATRPGAVRVDAGRNVVLIQGTGTERRNAINTVLSFDADWMRGQSVGIFPIRNSTPEPIVAEIERIMDTGEGGLGQNMVKFQPIARLNAILVVSRKPDLVASAGTWIARLDQSDNAGTNLKVYRLRYGNARQIAALLTDIFGARTGATASLDNAGSLLAPGGGAAVSSNTGVLRSLGVTPPRQSIAIATTEAPGAAARTAPGAIDRPTDDPGGPGAAGRGGAATGDIRITADVANNSILVFTDQQNHRLVEQTLRQIDRPQLQVAIDATIAEVTLNDNLNYGVQFFLKSKDVGLGDDKGSIINSIGGAVLAQAFPGFNFVLGSKAEPRLILDALHGVTDVKILSTPSIVVLNNQVATLQVGDEVPISTGTATVLTSNNTVVNTIDYRNTGVILRVLPRVNANGNVVLEIEQEISNVSKASSTSTSNSSSTTTPNLTPTVSQRRVKSSIAVASGQTVLLAGLISDQEDLDRKGIPILDSIPGIGNLFATQNRTNTRTELILFIRPQIIRTPVDANLVAEELRSKLHGRLVGSTPARGGVPSSLPFR